MGKYLAFVKSVLIGSVVGGGPFMPLTLFLASYPTAAANGRSPADDVMHALQLAVLPLAIAFVIVLSASVLIGLPLTYAFRRKGLTGPGPYLVSGILVGVGIPIIMPWAMGWSGMAWMAIPGALSGAATSRVWWGATRVRAGGVTPSCEPR